MTEHRSEWINFEEEEKKSQERIKASLDIKVKGASTFRLESIKEEIEESLQMGEHGILMKRVDELLQRLERYEKALKDIEHRAASYTDHESVRIVLNEVREMAVIARKE